MSSIELRAIKLPIGVNYLRCKSFNSKDANSAIANFYEIGPISHRNKASLDLLEAFIMEPIFYVLRTIEQLAYLVSFDACNHFGILGYEITVNSQETNVSAEYVEDRIEQFRRNFKIIYLEEMLDEDFNTKKAIVVKNKLNNDNKLSDEVKRNWMEIKNGEYVFDRLEKEAEHLSAILRILY